MKIKHIFAVLLAALAFAGCKHTEQLTEEEKEYRAVKDWFYNMTDEDTFPDVRDYEYYARTLDLDSGYFLDADMWNIFYNSDINRNRDIDGKAVYLIALDTDKLIEVWADRNGTAPENICKDLSITADELRYNFGYTAGSENYSKNHKDGIVTYSDKEQNIFGRDNGEDRAIVFGTHFLEVDLKKYKVTYKTGSDSLAVLQRDFLHSETKSTYNYSAFTDEEKNGTYKISNTFIKRVTALDIPNAWKTSADEDKNITVMFNCSPYSYGCTDEDIIRFNEHVTEETEVSG